MEVESDCGSNQTLTSALMHTEKVYFKPYASAFFNLDNPFQDLGTREYRLERKI